MTKQEVFTKVWTTLQARGFTRAGITTYDGGFRCQYHSPVGPCAIGIFIPDELYDPAMDEQLWQTQLAIERAPELLALAELEYIGLFFEDLQSAHDQGVTPRDMEIQLRKFARDYNLEIPA